MPPPRTNALLSYYHSTARNRGAALRWNTEGHEYKMVFDAQINGAVWTPVPAANAGSARGRALMGGGGGAEHGGANCTGNGNQMRCFWLFDLSVDDDERLNIFDDNRGQGGVVATMTNMLNSWAEVEVTCEEAQTCGPVDPAATPAFQAAGYLVPWINVPASV